jgi:hypothetical protein
MTPYPCHYHQPVAISLQQFFLGALKAGGIADIHAAAIVAT